MQTKTIMIFSLGFIAILISLVSANFQDSRVQKQFESTYKSIQSLGSSKQFTKTDVVSKFCSYQSADIGSKQDCLQSSFGKWGQLWNEIAQFEQSFGVPFVRYVSQRGFGMSSEPQAEQVVDMIDALFQQIVEESPSAFETLFGDVDLDSNSSFIKTTSDKKHAISKMISSSPKQFVSEYNQLQCAIQKQSDDYEAPEDVEMTRDSDKVNLYRRGFGDAALFGSFAVTNVFAVLGAALLLEVIGFAIYGLYNVCTGSSCCRN